jgi:tetratricopeptide (TPR) repeat protein
MKKQTKKPIKILVSPQSQSEFNKGVKCYESGDLTGSVAHCENAIKLSPNHTDALHLLGVIMGQVKQYVQALSFFTRSLEINPHNPTCFNNRANVFQEMKQPELAIDDFDQAIALDPTYADAYYNKGITLDAINRTEEAIEQYTIALKHKPAFPEAMNNRGIALQKLHRMEETLANYDQAIALKPNLVEAFHNNKGLVLQNLMRVHEALAEYDKALAIVPNLEDARFNRSLCLLLVGDYKQAWHEHEWRWKRSTYPRPNLPGIPWLGKEDIKGRAILIHGEQGLGDMLQFCRYVSMVKAMGATVILAVEKALGRLLQNLEGVDVLITNGDPFPPFDYYISILSLPLALGTDSIDKIPNEPYLKVDPAQVAYWEKKLGPKKKKRVGIVWSGGFRPDQPEVWAVNERRNIALEKLAPLFDVDVEFYSLQKGEPAETELASSQYKDKLINYTKDFTDFADTAAFIECLDLVICVDTSTCHVAAAMGKKVWMMNRFDTCWRWFIDRTDSPWYPSITLYRQPKLGDWETVVNNIKKDLIEWAK